MDTSKEHILMSEKSLLKDSWIPTMGDYFYHNVLKGVYFIIHTDRDNYYEVEFVGVNGLGPYVIKNDDIKEKTFPLFRQDQLQKMISSKWYKIWNIQSHFMKFAGGEYPFYPYCSLSHFHSMEQLWLAFIMKEKFNKYWDGKNWDNFKK